LALFAAGTDLLETAMVRWSLCQVCNLCRARAQAAGCLNRTRACGSATMQG